MGLLTIITGIIIICLAFLSSSQKIISIMEKNNKVMNKYKYIKIQRIFDFFCGSIFLLLGVLLLLNILWGSIIFYVYMCLIVIWRISDRIIKKIYI